MSSFDYRGGRRPWHGFSGSTPLQGPIKTPPAPPLGLLLEKMTPLQFAGDDDGAQEIVSITDTKFLASYNWTEGKDVSIVFPGESCGKNLILQSLIIQKGMPALWDPPSEATKLPQDSGEYFRDQNAARHPKHPMEPAVKAVLAQNPHFDTEAVDVFGCTSTLGNLLRFLKNDDKTFRFAVENVGRTVFFVRRENAPDELIAGPRGFGPTGHGMF
jgi:hypothetical protein